MTPAAASLLLLLLMPTPRQCHATAVAQQAPSAERQHRPARVHTIDVVAGRVDRHAFISRARARLTVTGGGHRVVHCMHRVPLHNDRRHLGRPAPTTCHMLWNGHLSTTTTCTHCLSTATDCTAPYTCTHPACSQAGAALHHNQARTSALCLARMSGSTTTKGYRVHASPLGDLTAGVSICCKPQERKLVLAH